MNKKISVCLNYYWATESLDFLVKYKDYIVSSLLQDNFLIIEDDTN